MPISTTIRRHDGGIYINADGLRTDQHGTPVSAASGNVTLVDPNGVLTATYGSLAYDPVGKKLWGCDSNPSGTAWTQLI